MRRVIVQMVWAAWLVVGVSMAQADETATTLVMGGPRSEGYVRLVQPVMVETLLVVRQPLDVGRHRRLDQRGQAALLEALMARVRRIEPPASAIETHRLILDGLERFRAAVQLRIEGQEAAANGRMAEPGIGPSLAARIVAYRQEHGAFLRVDDLERVSGIGPKTVQRLRGKVIVDR